MVMGFFAFVNFFTLRVNLSVAIVAMVNSTYLREIDAAAAAAATANVSSRQRLNLSGLPDVLESPVADDNSTDDDLNVSNFIGCMAVHTATRLLQKKPFCDYETHLKRNFLKAKLCIVKVK